MSLRISPFYRLIVHSLFLRPSLILSILFHSRTTRISFIPTFFNSFIHTHTLSLSYLHSYNTHSLSFSLTIKTARRIFRDTPRPNTEVRWIRLHDGKRLNAFNLESDAPLCSDRLPHPPPRRRRLLWQDAPRDRSIAWNLLPLSLSR